LFKISTAAIFQNKFKPIGVFLRIFSASSFYLSSRNLNKSNSDSPQPSVERLDQIPSTYFYKNKCWAKGDSARAKRAPIWYYATDGMVKNFQRKFLAERVG